MDINILLVEDDASLRMVIRETLEIEGFTVFTASDGIEGLKIFFSEKTDIVIADIMLPRLDGIEMVGRIRQRNQLTPIIFLTAKSSVESVVEGFQAGADDYLRKPFSMKELIVRIKALHHRANASDSARPVHSNHINIGLYIFDPVSQSLSYGDNTSLLSAKESKILAMLVNNINKIVDARNIMIDCWGDDSPYIANSLQVFITRLRQHLKKDPSVKIVNARGIGYKLVVDVVSGR